MTVLHCVCVFIDPEGSPNGMFDELLAITVEPLVEICRTACAKLNVDATLDSTSQPNRAELCLLNCLLEIWGMISKQSSCSGQATLLKQSIDTQVLTAKP